MTFNGAGISDDEANSWEDEISESDDSANLEYYDEEDDTYDASASPKKPGEEEKKDSNTGEGDGNQ